MIAGIFHEGSGLGNQIHRYVMARVLAKDKGVDFGMVNPHLFKGASFLSLDMGKPVQGIEHKFNEERVNNKHGEDIRDYDWSIKKVKDNTCIDGEFQGEDYYKHRLGEIREWFKTDPLFAPENECVITFRGGEYLYFPDLFLTKKYWSDAIEHMKKINPKMTFRVITDDVETARQFFPYYIITHEIGDDWRSIRYAKYLILSNSSFGILPTLLNEDKKFVIAPMYWARHNVSDGYWCLEQNKYAGWNYQDRNGKLQQVK